ncbi:HPr family phosphocarrier protein [Rathayibacter soli]|uniref:HPr family phosphocarrier protein n=1 Tax=Rathayibacter soli TaxID=3144168 RepID=UPI0027E5527C|nr:HPr family phosphocarrier protein [Glaciibacter superstes]
MIERTIRIGSSHGLHARPAKLFVQAVAAAGIPVTIAKGSGKPVSASSILGVISLGIDHGDYVTLTSDAEGAASVLDDLTEVLVTDHDNV